MKVALAHDWLTGMRGGERVLEAILELFPDAPLYTLIYKKKSTSSFIEDRIIHTSFLNNIPGIEKHYRKFLPLFPLAVERMKIEEKIDLLISSSHCVIKGLKKNSETKHLSYIHSPMRYIYDQFETYFGPQAPLYQQWGARLTRNYLTSWDLESNKNVDVMVANSAFVAQRISNYYNRESEVVHPFVDLRDFEHLWNDFIPKEDYYCMVTAFAPNKRVDLAIETFNLNQKKLIIIGSGQEELKLRSMSKSNIVFLGNVSREKIIKTLSKAKALIFPGVEDFGITPLESLAALTPVIAYKKAGVLETLNDSVSVFFEEQSVDHLKNAIEKFEIKKFKNEDLLKQAKNFSKEKFKKELMMQIERLMNV